MDTPPAAAAAAAAGNPAPGPPVGPQVIFAVDADCVCTLSTGPGLAALGVAPGQLVGRNLLDEYRDDPDSRAALHRVLAGETFSSETPFHGRILSVYYEPLRGPDGAVTGAIGVSTDVTEQRRTEAEVRAARERATLLADLSAGLNQKVLALDSLLEHVARSAATGMGDACLVWIYQPASPALLPRSGWGFDEELIETWRLQPDETIELDTYLREEGTPGGPRILDLVAERARGGAEGEVGAVIAAQTDLHSDLRVPLRSRGLLIGALDIFRRNGSPAFSGADLSLALEVAERCALAIDNALLLAAEREAREDLVKFKALADASSNLIAINGPDGAPLYVNPRVHQIGVEPDRESLWTTVAERLGGEVSETIRTALVDSGRWTGDVTIPDLGMVVRADVFTLQHPVTAAPLGTAWIGEDVTGLRTTERALREAVADLKRFKALVEASPDFIAIADLDGTVRYVNPRGRAMIGLGESVDVTTTTIADYLTPEGLVASVEVEQPAVVQHGHWEGESTLRDWRGGPPVPVAIASFLMRDADSGESFALATVQRDITERLAAENALRRLADQRQALLSRLVDAQDAERRRIAADVHDDPVQALAALDLRLGLLRRRVREQAPDLLEPLEAVQHSVGGATDRLRALLFDLEPPALDHGLGTAVRRCAEDVFESGTLHASVDWEVDDSAEPEAPEATRAVGYRIAREALLNVRKHAGAERVRVVVGREGDTLRLTVTDDGAGPGDAATSLPGHRGVTTMQDRAAAAGGTCTVLPGPDGGTVVTATLPLL